MIQSSKPYLPPRRSNSIKDDNAVEKEDIGTTSSSNQNDVRLAKHMLPPPRPPTKPRVVSLQEGRRPNLVQRSRSLQISASEIRSLFGVDKRSVNMGDEDDDASLLRNSNYTALP